MSVNHGAQGSCPVLTDTEPKKIAGWVSRIGKASKASENTLNGKDVFTSEFRRFAGHFASGIAIVTTRSTEGQLYGLTMNAVTSLSLDPPLYLICMDNNSNTLRPIMEKRIFCLNFLTEDQRKISNLFASKSEDKFLGIEYSLGPIGTPMLKNSLAACECRLEDTYPGGDHTIIVGRVHAVTVNEGQPLVCFRGKYIT